MRTSLLPNGRLRRCTVLPGTPVQNKLDIKLRLTGTENPIL